MLQGKSITHIVGHIMYIIYIILFIDHSLHLLRPSTFGSIPIPWMDILCTRDYFYDMVKFIAEKRQVLIGKSVGRECLIECGPYALVRHPEFLGHILIIFSLVLISQHWISLLVYVMLITLLYIAMLDGERRNIEKFGAAYKDYMKKVPRINLLAGVIREIRCKRRKRCISDSKRYT